MPIKYVLSQAGVKMGLNPDITDQRAVLLRFLNEAAEELYMQSDMAGSLMEQVFQVNGDQTIALPQYVGYLRAMREYNSQIAWHLTQMRPRYNVANWSDMWRNFRLKNKSPLQKSVTNQAVLVVSVSVVETPAIEVTIRGSTTTATSVEETVVLSSASVTTVNAFTDVLTITKNQLNTHDVTIADIDGNVLAVIPNNELQSSYQIVDVSTLPWSTSTASAQDHLVEVLYKKSLPQLSLDSDEFPARGYDNVLVNKILQLWSEEKGEAEAAMGYDAKASRSLARIHQNQNAGTEDAISLTFHPHDTLLVKVRTTRPGRYTGYGYPYLLR
jgi:hypothetical protein